MYVCDCKGYKSYAICSHVLAINHILKEYNVRHQIREMGKSTIGGKKSGGGSRKVVEPALTKAPTREPDSSDEEEERIRQLGEQGK